MSVNNPAVSLQRVRDVLPRAMSGRLSGRELISLAKDPVYENKAFFGTLIHKFFSAFNDDLQDRAVDAILDLCEDEDEKTRIIGIKGLGATGKAEPRWVRGNTGVLLQLLECPPTELRHVHDSLFALMSVSAGEVLQVMTDDCSGSESETGASRRLILNFLLEEARDIRRQMLDSGTEPLLERSFREGFYGALRNSGLAEKRDILGMIMTLASVSGPGGGAGALERDRWEWVRHLTEALRRDSDKQLTFPFIKLFVDFKRRLSEGRGGFDPRWTLHFLADHGKAVVGLWAEKDNELAKELLLGLRNDVPNAIKRWGKGKAPSSDLEEKSLIMAFTKTMFFALLSNKSMSKRVDILEPILHAIYTLITFNEDLRPKIPSRDCKDLLDLADDARDQSRSSKLGEGQKRRWQMIQNLCDLLGDERSRVKRVVPSWELEVEAQEKRSRQNETVNGNNSTSSHHNTADAASTSTLTSRPRHETDRPATPPLPVTVSASAIKTSNTGSDSRNDTRPQVARQTKDTTFDSAELRFRGPRSSSNTIPTPPFQTDFETQPEKATEKPHPPSLSIRSALATVSSNGPPTLKPTDTVPPAVSPGPARNGNATLGGGLQIRSAATPKPVNGLSIKHASTRDSASKPISGPVPIDTASASASAIIETGSRTQRSLLERLQPQSKRPRSPSPIKVTAEHFRTEHEMTLQPQPTRTLAERLRGPVSPGLDSKRIRLGGGIAGSAFAPNASSDVGGAQRRSLKDRMGIKSSIAAEPSMIIFQPRTLGPVELLPLAAVTMDPSAESRPLLGSRGLTIRSQVQVLPPSIPVPMRTMNIRTTSAKHQEVVEEVVMLRKGRGFRAPSPEDV